MPWENPQVGDVLTMRDGRKRTLCPFSHGYGGWVEFAVVSKFGRPAKRYASLSGWKNTARVEVAKGGSYERGGEG